MGLLPLQTKSKYENNKNKDDWDVDKSERNYCQYEDGYACRNSDTLRLFEVEI